jgi:hypothetical protein
MRFRVCGRGLVAVFVLAGLVRAADDDRIAKLEELVKAQAEMLKSQADMLKTQGKKLEALEQQQVQTAKGTPAQQVDKALARTPVSASVLAPDKPAIKGTGLSFAGEFLYWTAQGEDNVIAYQAGLPGLTLGDAKRLDLGWSPGFRLGLDYQLPYDGWDLGLSYTYFRSDAETTLGGNGTEFFFIPGSGQFLALLDGMDAGRVDAKRNLSYDHFDVELGRKSKLTDSLSVRFMGGPSFVSIKDERQTNYFDGEASGGPSTIVPPYDGTTYGLMGRNSTESFLYGLRLGADGEMKLPHGFALNAKVAGALYAGKSKHHTLSASDGDRDGVVDPVEVVVDSNNDYFKLIPAVEFEGGVSWERKLLDSLNFKVFAGYQFRNYFGLLERQIDNGFFTTQQQKDLGFQGLVFRVRLDF